MKNALAHAGGKIDERIIVAPGGPMLMLLSFHVEVPLDADRTETPPLLSPIEKQELIPN